MVPYLCFQPLGVHVESPPAVVAARERPAQEVSPEDGVPRLADHVLLALDPRRLQVALYLKSTKTENIVILSQILVGTGEGGGKSGHRNDDL